MIKTKLASQDKSKHCSHSKCPYPSVIRVIIEGKARRLCQGHIDSAKRKGIKFEVVFQRASLL